MHMGAHALEASLDHDMGHPQARVALQLEAREGQPPEIGWHVLQLVMRQIHYLRGQGRLRRAAWLRSVSLGSLP
jgi:hypothetical protein